MLMSLSLGCGSTVTTFDEDEIVAGDLVKVELDLELLKMMHESVGLWSSTMSEVKCFMIDDCVSALLHYFSLITVVWYKFNCDVSAGTREASMQL